jgi:hypothetical protein
MLRTLHAQGVLADGGSDLRFNMRPGGNPERRDFGGVVEAFTVRGSGRIELRNRFGEVVGVDRAGTKVELAEPLTSASGRGEAGMARARGGATRDARHEPPE